MHQLGMVEIIGNNMSVNRNILDALRDVHEGMLTSMRHNKKMSKDGELWLKAIMSGDSSHIPMNNVDSPRIFNKSKLNTNAKSHLSGAILSRSLNSSIYSYVYLRVYKVGSTSYISFVFTSNTVGEFSRALIHEADDDTIAEIVLDFNSGKLKADKPVDVDSFKGCKLVASTYYDTVIDTYYKGLDDFLFDVFSTLTMVSFSVERNEEVSKQLERVLSMSEPFIYIDDVEQRFELNFVTSDKASLSEVYDILKSICYSNTLVKTSRYVGLVYEM